MGQQQKEAMNATHLYGDIIEIKYYTEKWSGSTSLLIQSQHWVGESQLFMWIVALDYSNNNNIVKKVNPFPEFYSYPSEYKNQDSPDTHTHMMNIYQILTNEYIIKA